LKHILKAVDPTLHRANSFGSQIKDKRQNAPLFDLQRHVQEAQLTQRLRAMRETTI